MYSSHPKHGHGSHVPDERQEDLTFSCSTEIPPAIPDGDQYEAMFVRAEAKRQWGQIKGFLWFKLITAGDSFGQEFFMAFNVPPKGRWTPSWKFWRAWVLAAGRRSSASELRQRLEAERGSAIPDQEFIEIAERSGGLKL